MKLLVPHRAPPLVRHWGMFVGLPEGTGEIKYSGWTKISKKIAMEKIITKSTTPGGSPGPSLVNPPSMEVDPMDSGGRAVTIAY